MQPPHSQPAIKKPDLTSLWIFLPALFFYAQVLKNATNIPITDDYEAILQWLHDFNHSHGWHRLLLLFRQHNEHRILHSRVVYLLYYWVTGGINFRNLIIIGDLQLVVIAWISAYFIRQTGIRYWQWAACVWMFCLFDLNTYESASIAMYGMQNYGVIMLFFLGLYFYDRQRPVVAAIFQFVLIFSSGNGQIGSLMLCGYTFFAGRSRAICWITGFAATALYYVGYHRVATPGAIPWNLSTAITFFVRNVGAYVDFDASALYGLLILGLLIWIFPYRTFRQHLPLTCIAGFALSSIGAAAVMRSCFTWAQFQASRYLIYPQILAGCILIFTFLKFSINAKTNPALPGSAADLREKLPLRKSRLRKNA